MVRCEPDKVRFNDPEAAASSFIIHTIELSDERSLSQFATLWIKGKGGERLEAWKNDHGLDDHHNRELYHRCGPWLPAAYPGKESEGWSHHCHVDLINAPTWKDLEPFAAEIPPALQEEIRTYLRGA